MRLASNSAGDIGRGGRPGEIDDPDLPSKVALQSPFGQRVTVAMWSGDCTKISTGNWRPPASNVPFSVTLLSFEIAGAPPIPAMYFPTISSGFCVFV
jgi:hypothetical protein